MLKLDLVYVLIRVGTHTVEMATSNDQEAWAHYRDMPHMQMHIFLNKNRVAVVPPKE